MKKNLNRTLLLTAAALTLSAAAAYGQIKITANIPFAFRTGGTMHAAGTYDVIAISSIHKVLALRDESTGKAVMLGLGTPEGGSTVGQSHPRLVFRCGNERGCVLSEVWTNDGYGQSYGARPKSSEPEHLAVVYLGTDARQ